VVVNPVYWSTTQIGDSVVFLDVAHAGMALLSAWMAVFEAPMPIGMICATWFAN